MSFGHKNANGKKGPRWFNPFGPARKNKKNRAALGKPGSQAWAVTRMDPQERRRGRNRRRNKRQAIARLAVAR